MSITVPRDTTNIPFEGGYDPVGVRTVAKELDSSTSDSGPLRAVISALNGAIGPAAAQPTTTNAGTETIYTLAEQGRHVWIQNRDVNALNFELDATVTLGSIELDPGCIFSGDIRVTAIHLLTTNAVAINGTAAGNIVIRAYL